MGSAVSDKFQPELAADSSSSALKRVQCNAGIGGIEQAVERSAAGLHADGHGRLGEAILLHGGLDPSGEDLFDGLFLALLQDALFGQKIVVSECAMMHYLCEARATLGPAGSGTMPALQTMSPRPSIAHYRIVSKLGEGGMGAVYRATDTKLNRDVAIKVLPDSFADRLARFTREAQVLASLNHPNIAAIYGVEEGALILELVEGPTLAERIAQGPIPVDEAL